MPTFVNPTHEDPFFFDREALQNIADDSAVNHGLVCFREKRVIYLDSDPESVRGQVAVEDDDLPVSVDICLSPDGKIVLNCDCEESREAVCCHQVALLFAYGDGKEGGDKLLSAADTAIRDRIKRGRSEVRVEHVNGQPWFGTWLASSISPAYHFSRQYRVTIRSLQKRSNICTCPDFNTNQLGTCKHIEAVLHKIRKRRDYKKIKEQPAPQSYIYLAWDVDEAPRITLQRCNTLTEDLQAILDPYFLPDGSFCGRVPEDFFRFVELVASRGDILVGEDAVAFARQIAAEDSHRLRVTEIRSRIMATSGKIPGVKARLYPYQVEGAAFLAGTGRALLADDMGLGKTLQAIAAGAWLKEHDGVRKILIICPASLKQQWAREIARFTDLASQVVQGPAAGRGVQYRREATFFIINYELVLRDLSVINETLRPDLVILDEAQRIKNWRTKIASGVKLIPSRYAFVLSGTPLENRLEDLYSLMQVVDQKVLGPLWRYLVDFHITDERGKLLGYRNLSLLRRRLEPVMLRRDRRLVSDQLPDRIVQRLDVAMTAKQLELHDAGMSNAGRLATIAKQRPLTPAEQNRLMAALQQARMACNAAGLVDKETEGSPKLDEMADLLDEVCLQSGLKAVVFSQWERMTRMAEVRLQQMGIGCVRLHGGVPTAQRGALMDRFREDDSVQVFLSTDAGGVGLNLQSGSVLVNLDVPWNPAVLEQRNARIHRLGQTRKVQIVTMVAAASYEDQVFELVRNKQNLFDNVVGEDASEDVVGVSKKLLETLIEDLAGEPESMAGEKEQESAGPEVEALEKKAGSAPTGGDADVEEQAIRDCIEQLQQSFGMRIDRILGSGGGLLVVLDRVDAAADELAVKLSEQVPVALIDLLALKGLQRLGAGSPVAEAKSYYDASEQAGGGGESRLKNLAAEKLKAARILLSQNLAESALEMAVASLLASASDRAGLEAAVVPQEAGVWIFSEALPKGFLGQEDAGLLMRGVSLAQGQAVPEHLISELVDDAARFVERGE